MKDKFDREINYLRISVTDKCNLRCVYCMPKDIQLLDMKEILTFEEIVEVVKICATLGIKAVKITGGEPLIRRDICSLIAMIKSVPGIETVTLTTNGILLGEMAEELKQAGIEYVNVSLDTVDSRRFEAVTGFNKLSAVLNGIENAVAAGLNVKINCVSNKYLLDENGKELFSLLDYCRQKQIVLRFIELMPIGLGTNEAGASNDSIFCEIEKRYKVKSVKNTAFGNGPAVYYELENGQKIGFISAIHHKFCAGCNRLRLTSTGKLKTCLCYESEVSIRQMLRSGELEKAKELIEKAILNKPLEHNFNNKERITEKNQMNRIGG